MAVDVTWVGSWRKFSVYPEKGHFSAKSTRDHQPSFLKGFPFPSLISPKTIHGDSSVFLFLFPNLVLFYLFFLHWEKKPQDSWKQGSHSKRIQTKQDLTFSLFSRVFNFFLWVLTTVLFMDQKSRAHLQGECTNFHLLWINHLGACRKKRKSFYKLLNFTPASLMWKLLDKGKVVK